MGTYKAYKNPHSFFFLSNICFEGYQTYYVSGKLETMGTYKDLQKPTFVSWTPITATPLFFLTSSPM